MTAYRWSASPAEADWEKRRKRWEGASLLCPEEREMQKQSSRPHARRRAQVSNPRFPFLRFVTRHCSRAPETGRTCSLGRSAGTFILFLFLHLRLLLPPSAPSSVSSVSSPSVPSLLAVPPPHQSVTSPPHNSRLKVSSLSALLPRPITNQTARRFENKNSKTPTPSRSRLFRIPPARTTSPFFFAAHCPLLLPQLGHRVARWNDCHQKRKGLKNYRTGQTIRWPFPIEL